MLTPPLTPPLRGMGNLEIVAGCLVAIPGREA